MASIQLYQSFAVVVDGRSITGGSLSKAASVTLGEDEVYDQTYKVAATAIVKVWDKAENEALGGFDFLWMESDLDVLVQFTTSAGVRDDYDVKTLKGSGTAGQMGTALVLGSNVTQVGDGAVDLFNGTAGTIDEIWVKNESSSTSARVRVVVAT
jgi:hypothetical protein